MFLMHLGTGFTYFSFTYSLQTTNYSVYALCYKQCSESDTLVQMPQLTRSSSPVTLSLATKHLAPSLKG